MDHGFPIYTEVVECQDCYKCVRGCVAKAIRVQDGHASILPELCTACGHCVAICPAKAKKIRSDVLRAQNLLKRKSRVYASLAPSWVAEFPGIPRTSIIAAFQYLGFAGVSETALGAQEVSAALLRELGTSPKKLLISSACPAVLEFINKYVPQYRSSITAMTSPLLAHARMLRKTFGDDIGIVFFGPCTAKKLEADRNKTLLDLALTFQDLRGWLSEAGVDPAQCTGTDSFVPCAAEEGTLYPIEGGMINTMEIHLARQTAEMIAVSGLSDLQYYLEHSDPASIDKTVFLEALACKGGCINGPCRSTKNSGLNDRLAVRGSYQPLHSPAQRTPSIFTGMPLPERTTDSVHTYSQREMKKALLQIGKTTPDDELNCGGCGYDTCRFFAEALIEHKAEPAMCVSFMRKKAQRKANAILRCMPAAAVVIDSSLRIVEANKHFAEMFGETTMQLYEVLPTLNGVYIEKIIPFVDLFRTVLRTGEDIVRENLRAGDKLLNISLFTIDPHQTIGGILQDATQVALRREAIANKANEVLRKNLNTVQGIAKLLGEHMADTEIILRSISKGFATGEEEPLIVHPPARR